MKQFVQRFWYYYFWLVLVVSFIFFFPVQWCLLQKTRWYPAAHRFRSMWARVLLFLCGIRYKIINRQYLPAIEPLIICSNHSSYLDIFVCCAVFKNYSCFMAKAELSKIPLFGIFFRTIDIEVDRESGERSASSYRKAVRTLDKGASLIIYPEGGIFEDPLKLKPFKDGAFQLAIRHRKAILPVSMPDNYKILPDPPISVKPGKIRIILHKPIFAESMAEKDKLKETLNGIIQGDLNK